MKNSISKLIFTIILINIFFISTNALTKINPITKTTGNACVLGECNINSKSFGLFLGVEKKDSNKIKNYDLIVIDADYYTKQEIETLKKQGNKKIFSYLNVGSLENFRDYYNQYKDITLKDYENWEEERWVDVSNKRWITHLADLSKELKDKNIDGFFLDNLDVYYHFNNDKIYNSIFVILEKLNEQKLPLIVNGGDMFISRAIKENKLKNLVYGINQETVFSKIDFENNRFYRAEKSDQAYFQNYLKESSDHELKVFITEYTKDEKLKKEIIDYCKKNSYRYFISSTIELNEVPK